MSFDRVEIKIYLLTYLLTYHPLVQGFASLFCKGHLFLLARFTRASLYDSTFRLLFRGWEYIS